MTAARDDRAAYRPYRAEVARIERMTPHFARVTFRGDELGEFGTDGLDQRIKLVFPRDGREPEIGLDDPEAIRTGNWYQLLREQPAARRPAFRTYTVRAVRPAEREIDVDFVDHGAIGPAGAWLAEADEGSPLVVVGPTALSTDSASGIDWHPGPARHVLLAGDETAAPAICAIVESLPDEIDARAFIEIPHAVDVLDLARRGDDVTWLMRADAGAGTELEHAVHGWLAQNAEAVRPSLAADAPDRAAPDAADPDDDDAPESFDLLWDAPVDPREDFYAWIAGEAGVVTRLRRHLVREVGLDRAQVAFMGYWKQGRAESQD